MAIVSNSGRNNIYCVKNKGLASTHFRKWLWTSIIFNKVQNFSIKTNSDWRSKQAIYIFLRSFNSTFSPSIKIISEELSNKCAFYIFEINYSNVNTDNKLTICILNGGEDPISQNQIETYLNILKKSNPHNELIIYSQVKPENENITWLQAHSNSKNNWNINLIKSELFSLSKNNLVGILHGRIAFDHLENPSDNFLFGTPAIKNIYGKNYLDLIYLLNYNVIFGDASSIAYGADRRRLISKKSKNNLVPYVDGGCYFFNKGYFIENPFQGLKLYWGEAEDVELSFKIHRNFGYIDVLPEFGSFISQTNKISKSNFHVLNTLRHKLLLYLNLK
jgi:hypothetical protein